MLAEIHKNDAKNSHFPALIDFKIAKNAVLDSNVLIKIYFQGVF
jgi:hypothetical protein